MRTDLDDILGLEQGKVRLCPHTALWTELYAEESRRLRDALSGRIVDLEHIGSTAIPGIKAKPILDIMLGVEDLETGPGLLTWLEPLGYYLATDVAIRNDVVFARGEARTHLLHVLRFRGQEWNRHLRFRDRLRADATLARDYERLKEALSREFADNRPAYTKAKTGFILAIAGDEPAG